MKKDEWFPFLSSLGLPCAYHHFEEGHSPAPPFLVYWFPASQNYGADITKEVKSDWSFILRKKALN